MYVCMIEYKYNESATVRQQCKRMIIQFVLCPINSRFCLDVSGPPPSLHQFSIEFIDSTVQYQELNPKKKYEFNRTQQ